MVVGSDLKITGNVAFGTEPYLIRIGDNVLVTDGVKFITHDGAVQVPFIMRGSALQDVYGVRSVYGGIDVGCNVFIGNNVIILPDTVIGDNSIIAAGSVVKGVYEGNSVIAGVPGKIISDIEAYAKKNMPKAVLLSHGVDKKTKIINALGKK